ncbi:hypothetical protein FACS189494_00720 [Spirochaetia bacterium]|nr:hypothetical protein FACS189494_00720 [Spirochaetia bacterium]
MDVYKRGVNSFPEKLSLVNSTYSYEINWPITNEKLGKLEYLTFKTIFKYPKEYVKKIMYKYNTMVSGNARWLQGAPFLPAGLSSNQAVDLLHKHKLYKIVQEFVMKLHSAIWNSTTSKISLITFMLVSLIFFRRMKTLVLINGSFLIYNLFIALYAPAAYSRYVFITYFYLHFMIGLFICEIKKSGFIPKKWVLPANVIVILAVIALALRPLGVSRQGVVWNNEKSLFESSATVSYPFYWSIFPKRLMLTAPGSAPSETLQSLKT